MNKGRRKWARKEKSMQGGKQETEEGNKKGRKVIKGRKVGSKRRRKETRKEGSKKKKKGRRVGSTKKERV